MLKRTKELEELDRCWEQRAYHESSFEEALGRFTALWRQARALGAEPGQDWLSDLEADFAVARAVNGLPPA